jgi:Tol biopolymer transport system component
MRLLARLVAITALFCAAAVVPATPAAAHSHVRNGLIVFRASTPEGDQLFTVRADGEGLRQITHVAGDAANPDWAPDGRHIVFGWGNENEARISIVDPDGSHPRTLPQPPGVFDDQPSYSPSGRRIYFERFVERTKDDAIWTMHADGTHQRRVLGPFPAGFVTDPNVSPDGRTLSFQGSDGSLVGPGSPGEPALGLFTADRRGKQIHQIRPFSTDQTIKVAWSPNSRRIASTENANHLFPTDSANIVTMRPDGSGVRMVTNFHDGVTNAYLGSYSPDGRWLVFRLETQGQFGLYRMRPDGSGLRVILPLSSFRPSLIDWGPQPRHRHDEG